MWGWLHWLWGWLDPGGSAVALGGGHVWLPLVEIVAAANSICSERVSLVPPLVL